MRHRVRPDVARRSLAEPAGVTVGRPSLCDGRLDVHAAAGGNRRHGTGRQAQATLVHAIGRGKDQDDGQKKARLGSRADKGLEIFSVNEKVCFGKQRSQYSERTSFHYP
ncbi:hypothetical protein BLAT2472_10127 [Burkholderia latens]